MSPSSHLQALHAASRLDTVLSWFISNLLCAPLHAPLSLHAFGEKKSLSIYFWVTVPPSLCGSSRYNCREEFQIHDDLLKANYTVGRISDATLEHYLVQVGIAACCSRTLPVLGSCSIFFLILQGKYFMVRDVYSKLDVLNTTASCGAPNFRQAKGGYAVFGMGQPSLGGFKLVLQKLQREGHKVGAVGVSVALKQSTSAIVGGKGSVGCCGRRGDICGESSQNALSPELLAGPWRRMAQGFGKPIPLLHAWCHPSYPSSVAIFPGVRLLLRSRGARALLAGGERLCALHATGQREPP